MTYFGVGHAHIYFFCSRIRYLPNYIGTALVRLFHRVSKPSKGMALALLLELLEPSDQIPMLFAIHPSIFCSSNQVGQQNTLSRNTKSREPKYL